MQELVDEMRRYKGRIEYSCIAGYYLSFATARSGGTPVKKTVDALIRRGLLRYDARRYWYVLSAKARNL